jgi:hypothetical protein
MSLGEYVARESAVALVFTNTCRWSGTSLGSLRKPEVPVLPGDLDATENTPDEWSWDLLDDNSAEQHHRHGRSQVLRLAGLATLTQTRYFAEITGWQSCYF